MMHNKRLFLFATLLIGFGPRAQAQVVYQNPVVAGDYPDPSIIRVEKDYWATATSSEWGPQFPVLHSTDLVNWEVIGAVFSHRPAWAMGNFWAPEISQYRGKYFVYYVGRKKDGPLAVAVATADQPSGPYTDHGPLVAQPAGSIDPVPVSDENGRRHLVWKEDGNSRKLPTILWAQPLADDGLKLVDKPKEILRNDAAWEGAVVEGPFLVHRGEWFYLFYSGSGCCGRNCGYALGVARAKSLLGPWVKNPANPILSGNERWKCPGHGSIVEDEQGRSWLMYHAYAAKDFVFTGREALLDEVKFSADDWPQINGGKGPSTAAPSPLGAIQQHPSAAGPPVDFIDEFDQGQLRPGWQWPQENEPDFKLVPGKGGVLTLSPRADFATNMLGALLARSSTSGDYEVTASLHRPKPGVLAGIAALGDAANATGLAIRDNKLVLWRRDKGIQKILSEIPAPTGANLRLRLQATDGHVFRFAASSTGENWIEVGDPQPGDHFPPWDRGVRVGLTVGGTSAASADFERFQMRSRNHRN